MLELRDEAWRQPDPAIRTALRAASDHIESALSDLFERPTREAMKHLNGLWARGEYWIKKAQSPA